MSFQKSLNDVIVSYFKDNPSEIAEFKNQLAIKKFASKRVLEMEMIKLLNVLQHRGFNQSPDFSVFDCFDRMCLDKDFHKKFEDLKQNSSNDDRPRNIFGESPRNFSVYLDN